MNLRQVDYSDNCTETARPTHANSGLNFAIVTSIIGNIGEDLDHGLSERDEMFKEENADIDTSTENPDGNSGDGTIELKSVTVKAPSV